MVKIHPFSESTLLKNPHLIPHTMVEDKKEKLIFAPPLSLPLPWIIHPDSKSTLLKTPHLIPHTMVEVNMVKLILPLPQGGKQGSDLENTSRLGIYTIENQIFDTLHDGRGQNR